MNGLNSAKSLNTRGARIYGLAALAALILLTATAAPARGQGKVSMRDISWARRGTVGMAPGQTLRVTAMNNHRSRDGSVRHVKARVKVYDAASNLLYKTEEVKIPSGGYHSFDVGYNDIRTEDLNDLYIFKSGGRIQLRFDVEFKGGVRAAVADVNGPAVDEFPATFELVDGVSGQSILIGLLLPAIQKVR
jgi:hypothetical protein